MSAVLSIEDVEFSRLMDSMKDYGAGAAEVVSDVVHSSGEDIYREIDPLIHPSGRTFKGHTSSAKGASWQRYDTSEALAITVASTASRRYLYFPDDGSTTEHHFGDQQFMRRGAEAAAPRILEKGIDALIGNFGRS